MSKSSAPVPMTSTPLSDTPLEPPCLIFTEGIKVEVVKWKTNTLHVYFWTTKDFEASGCGLLAHSLKTPTRPDSATILSETNKPGTSSFYNTNYL